MSKPKLLLVGGGGHARACIDVIEQQRVYQISGLIGLPAEVGRSCLGYPVIGTDADLPMLSMEYRFAFIAIGQIQSPETRLAIYLRLLELGFQLPAVISPTAYVSRHAVVGDGSIVMHGAIVNAGAEVGENCIINTRALIEHDAKVASNSHISTGAIVNGNARIGAGTFIGSCSVVREGIVLGEGCTVGMGLSVRHDKPNGTRVVG